MDDRSPAENAVRGLRLLSACERYKDCWLQVDPEPDDHSHMIDSDHMAHVRLVKQ